MATNNIFVNESQSGTPVIIVTERSGRDGSGLPTYNTTLGNVTTATITSGTHGLTNINGVAVYTADNQSVSVAYVVDALTVIIQSNISLLNHKLKIY